MTEKSVRSGRRSRKPVAAAPRKIEIDAWRNLVFPNEIRKFRKQRNIGSLLELAEQIPDLTYIRLSKIERGEVFARTAELRAIAAALHVAPADLLIDIDKPAFDIGNWAEPIVGSDHVDPESDRIAVLIAAAVRARRAADDALTISVLEEEYGIAPVILSRIENAHKPFDRWNDDVRKALRRLLGAKDDSALIAEVAALHADGKLDDMLPLVANPRSRIAKTRARIAALRKELAATEDSATDTGADTASPRPAAPPAPRTVSAGSREPLETAVLEGPVPVLDAATPAVLPAAEAPAPASKGHSTTVRLVPVYGSALPDGLLARTPTDALVEAPRGAGPRTYGLRIGRSTLGPGLPGRAILVVDPDRFPSAGGLAVIEQDEGLRVIAITFDRQGQTLGFSLNPDIEVALDAVDPGRVASVLSAIFE